MIAVGTPSTQISVSKFYSGFFGEIVNPRSEKGKVADDPGSICCTRNQGSKQRIRSLRQKDIGVRLEGLPGTKPGTA